MIFMLQAEGKNIKIKYFLLFTALEAVKIMLKMLFYCSFTFDTFLFTRL